MGCVKTSDLSISQSGSVSGVRKTSSVIALRRTKRSRRTAACKRSLTPIAIKFNDKRRYIFGARAARKEIAQSIVFLCSDEASYITGTTLTPDGGYTLTV